MTSHLAHASATRLMEYIDLLPDASARQRARRIWVRSIDKDWNEEQLAGLLRKLATRQEYTRVAPEQAA